MPEMVKELRRNLLAESKENILKACKHKLANWLAVSILYFNEKNKNVITFLNPCVRWAHISQK